MRAGREGEMREEGGGGDYQEQQEERWNELEWHALVLGGMEKASPAEGRRKNLRRVSFFEVFLHQVSGACWSCSPGENALGVLYLFCMWAGARREGWSLLDAAA